LQAVGGHVEHREVGDDPVDDSAAREGEGTLLDDLRRAVLGDVLGDDQDPAGPRDEVHRPAHALDDLAGDRPVRQVSAGRHLHCAEDRGSDVPAADHREGGR